MFLLLNITFYIWPAYAQKHTHTHPLFFFFCFYDSQGPAANDAAGHWRDSRLTPRRQAPQLQGHPVTWSLCCGRLPLASPRCRLPEDIYSHPLPREEVLTQDFRKCQNTLTSVFEMQLTQPWEKGTISKSLVSGCWLPWAYFLLEIILFMMKLEERVII